MCHGTLDGNRYIIIIIIMANLEYVRSAVKASFRLSGRKFIQPIARLGDWQADGT